VGVIHDDIHSVAELEDAGADKFFALLQPFGHRDEIAARFPGADELLAKGERFFARLFVLSSSR
jgi:hypothetical protein